ncbi:related to VPS53-subunit of VP51-54 complex, required for protein sorting [Armillaria ostoyae]|uniref:Related to VPS53-subunit of VP51-54 complex, required for protein sorting n=1 Tax=Armillaria ostoyae TaxID=47428 RepID=A0A284QKS7_ARMOS|nr:related to VPS53-subunit of VP51-54 complex, required for protein sorting [Armillaria ostoyae]
MSSSESLLGNAEEAEKTINGISSITADLGNGFNLVDILNSHFPDEASLAETEALQIKIHDDQLQMQKEINALQTQLKQSQDSNKMQLIQELISELLGQMSRIREKATESEAVVRNITKDIQVLDLAKKNLILSMTTLKRLQMLVNALTQLEDLVKERKYSEMAQTLSAVKEIAAAFKPMISVPRVSQVWRQIQQVQGAIRTIVEADFDKFYLEDPNKQLKASMIADACLVVDALGNDVRSTLIDRYVSIELKEYRQIFRTTDEAGQLDNISRRFSWFHRLLQSHELYQGRIFPGEWRVGWRLLCKFVEITREDFSALLSKAGKSLNVKTLLDNLQLTADFEASMSKKWATPFTDLLAVGDLPTGSIKPITTAFESHMGVFVDAQDKALADMLAPHRKSKTASSQPRGSLEATSTPTDADDGSSPLAVLPSSTELFYFYGQSLEQCAKLSAGQPLFDLCSLHKKWLKIYAEDVLIASLKRPAITSQGRKSMESRYDVDVMHQASLVINTADYCQATALELEQKIREKINAEFKDRVSLQRECDLFVGAVSSAISVQLRELEVACDPAFTTMTRTSWTSLAQVVGPSAYTSDLVRAAEQVIEAVKPRIEQKKYLRNLFDKAYNLILTKFTTSLVKSRPLGEIGAEQLLIDLQSIKAYLTKMPGDALTTTTYTRGLSKITSRLESLLKVIVTPVDPPEGFILNYTLLIGDASFSNFQKILDLKGTPRVEQNNLLDLFVTITSTKNDLDSTSFLTSLDMEPNSAQIVGGLISPMIITPASDGVFSGLISPPISGPPTGSSLGDSGSVNRPGERREVFSDFRRFVSFGLRRDSQTP